MSKFDDTRPLVELLRAFTPGIAESAVNNCPRVWFKNGLFAKENLIAVEGAITTEQRFIKWEDSLCHLCDDGRVMRYGEQIATRDDLHIYWPLQLTQ